MTGTQNLLIGSFVPGPQRHPVYSLDGLGVNDPPVIPISFGATDTFVDFTYALPTDGNQYIGIFVVACFNPVQTRNLSLSFEGSPVFTFDTVGPTSTSQVNAQVGLVGGLTGSNWRLTRDFAVDGAIAGNLRIYTFGDCAINGGIFNFDINQDLSSDPAPTVTAIGGNSTGAVIFSVGTRDDWVAGRNFSITDPTDYTYSPTGSAGVGLLDNGATCAAAVEFKFVVPPEPAATVEWTFSSPQVSEFGGLIILGFDGALY